VNWALRNFTLIDGTGKDPFRANVLIRDGLIEDVSPAADLSLPDDTFAILDGEGKWLTPGLINCHEHILNKQMHDLPSVLATQAWRMHVNSRPPGYQALLAAMNAWRVLQQGVTTIREMSGPHVADTQAPAFTNVDLRDAIKEGLVGPRILACRLAVSMTGGHGYPWYATRPADGCDEVRKAVREQIQGTADFIKVMASAGFAHYPDEDPLCDELSIAELRVVTEEAHRRGMLIAAHALSDKAVRNAVEAGVDSVEHGYFVKPDTLKLMAEKEVSFVPTVMVGKRIAESRSDSLGDLLRTARPLHSKLVREAIRLGIPLGVGTDSRFSMVEEMDALLECGLSPIEVMVAATGVAAGICGLDDVGTVERHKKADLLVLSDSPLEDLRGAFAKVAVVLKEGQALVPWCPDERLRVKLCAASLVSDDRSAC